MGGVKSLVLLLLVQLAPTGAPAQRPPSHAIRWWEAAVGVGAISGISLLDRSADHWIQSRRSSHSDAVARSFRNGGQPAVVFGIPGGILVAGLISGRKDLQRSGGRVLASVVTAGLITGAIKIVTGRLRPDHSDEPYVFKPFSSNDAFPSGHATVAFALATSIGTEIHRPWATGLLYAAASGTAWSRLNDHKHWLSDVVAGATVGITAGKIMEGRWRVFSLGAPRFLFDAHGARLEWHRVF